MRASSLNVPSGTMPSGNFRLHRRADGMQHGSVAPGAHDARRMFCDTALVFDDIDVRGMQRLPDGRPLRAPPPRMLVDDQMCEHAMLAHGKMRVDQRDRFRQIRNLDDVHAMFGQDLGAATLDEHGRLAHREDDTRNMRIDDPPRARA